MYAALGATDAEYNAKRQALATVSASKVKRGRELLVKYGSWLRRYCGGMPVGIFSAIMAAESDGNMGAPGDVSLGEAGFFQITSSFPPEVGLPAAARFDPETNVFLGGLEYQVEAAKAVKQWPNVVRPGTADQWKLARLSFAIGWGGTRALVTKAFAATSSGSPYRRVMDYCDKTGAHPYGSQSAAKVWYRVYYVDYNFRTGQQVAPGTYGRPTVLPAPPKYPSYRFPSDLLPFTGGSSSSGLTLAALAVAAGLLIARYR